MRRVRKDTGLWNYLNKLGVLATGDDAAIVEARKTYWRNYRSEHKRKKRKQKLSFTLTFTPKETQEMSVKAYAYGYRITKYIKACVRADIERSIVVPYPLVLREIEQLLLTYLNTVKEISERDMKGWLSSNRNYAALEETIQRVETIVLEKFRYPPPLETEIENVLRSNPYFIIKIKALLHKYNDPQKHDS
jgi:hypothetical protein